MNARRIAARLRERAREILALADELDPPVAGEREKRAGRRAVPASELTAHDLRRRAAERASVRAGAAE